MEIIEAWHIWLALGIALIALETIAPGFVLGSFAIGAFVTSVSSFFGISLNVQIMVFSIASIISFLLLRPFVVKYLNGNEEVKTNVDSLVGKIGIVTKDFDGNLKRGRVKAGGDDWLAENSGIDDLKKGDAVIVEKIESIILIVKKKDIE